MGECPEQDLRACSNGRDDDRDGLVDARDPRCWPFATFSVDRSCVEVRGGVADWPGTPATPDTPATPRAEIEVSDELRVVEGPTAIVFPPGGPGFFYGTSVVTGHLGGMTIDMDIDVAPGRSFEVGVIRDGRQDTLATSGAQGTGIYMWPSSAELRANEGGSPMGFIPSIVVGAQRAIHVEIEIRAVGEGFDAVFVRVDGERLDAHRRLRSGWTGLTPVRIYARAGEGDVEVGVRSIRVTRSPFDCGPVVPEAPALDGQLRRVLAAVDTGRDVVCAVVAAGPLPDGAASSLDVMRSRDCGATFELAGTIDMTEVAMSVDMTPPEAVASAAALVVSDDGEGVDLAVGLPTDGGLNRVALGTLSIHDCSIVRDTRASGLQIVAAMPRDPLLRGFEGGARSSALGLGPARGATTRLWIVSPWTDRVSRTVSPCPDAMCRRSCGLPMGTWDCGNLILRLTDVPELVPLGAGVIELGGDVIVTAVRYGGEPVALIPAVSGDSSRELQVPLSIGAAVPGAFDELGVGFPTLMPFLPDTACDSDGLLFVGGLPASLETTAIETEVLPYWFTIPAGI